MLAPAHSAARCDAQERTKMTTVEQLLDRTASELEARQRTNVAMAALIHGLHEVRQSATEAA
jgi:hypothetical protein